MWQRCSGPPGKFSFFVKRAVKVARGLHPGLKQALPFWSVPNGIIITICMNVCIYMYMHTSPNTPGASDDYPVSIRGLGKRPG